MSESQDNKDRFDLEAEIFAAWNIVEDIKTVLEYIDNDCDMKAVYRDKLGNMLIGMRELYDLKFNKVFYTFEELLRNGNLK